MVAAASCRVQGAGCVIRSSRFRPIAAAPWRGEADHGVPEVDPQRFLQTDHGDYARATRAIDNHREEPISIYQPLCPDADVSTGLQWQQCDPEAARSGAERERMAGLRHQILTADWDLT
jgi:hypothetical protein